MDNERLFNRFSNSLLGIVRGRSIYDGNIHAAYREITETAAITLNVNRASIWEYNGDRSSIHCVDLFEQDSLQHSEGHVLTKQDFPAYFSAMEQNRAIDAHDAHNDERTSEFSASYLRPFGITSMLDAPVYFNGGTFGVICLEHIGPARQWSTEEMTYAGSLADLISHALESNQRKQAETTLRKSEDRFRTLYHQSPVGLSFEDYSSVKTVVDNMKADGVVDFFTHFKNNPNDLLEAIRAVKLIEVNDTQLTIFGASDFEQYVEFDNEHVATSSSEWREYYLEEISSFAMGKKTMSREVQGMRVDGSPFELNCISRLVDGHEDDWAEIITTHEDITVRKLAETERLEALHQAEQANKAKTTFLATLSHEFRTPLNAILGFSEMLRAQILGPLGITQYKEYADNIFHSGQHLLSMVDDVLDISAIEAGKRTLNFETISVDEVLKDCIKNIEGSANDASVQVSLKMRGTIIEFVTDGRSIKQIVYNLLSNAIKYSGTDAIVSVSAYISIDEMILIVTDKGAGIPADKIDEITEPFSQVDSNPHRAAEGSGLGLSIVKSLVHALSGKLNIESKVGKGTTVTISIPAPEYPAK